MVAAGTVADTAVVAATLAAVASMVAEAAGSTAVEAFMAAAPREGSAEAVPAAFRLPEASAVEAVLDPVEVLSAALPVRSPGLLEACLRGCRAEWPQA